MQLKFRIAILMVGIVSLAALVSACGGGGSSSSGSSTAETSGSSAEEGAATTAASSSSSAQKGLESAEKKVAELEQPPTPIEPEPLSKTPPKGKTVDLVSCPAPGCKLAESSVLPAAELLGWKVKSISAALTPEGYVAAVNEALQDHPDYIILTALQANETIKSQLAQAKEEGIPVASFASSSPPESGMVATIFGVNTLANIGVSLANWVTADSQGKGKVVVMENPAEPSWVISNEAFNKSIGELCPECEVDSLEYSGLEVGKGIPGQVVSYLQKNPETEYIVTGWTAVFAGVPAAIKSAGFENVQLGGGTGTPADYQITKENDPPYVIAQPEQEGGYRALDVFARLAVGDPIEPCCTDPELKEQLINAETVETFDSTKEWEVPELAQSFAKAWHVKIPAGFQTITGVGAGE